VPLAHRLVIERGLAGVLGPSGGGPSGPAWLRRLLPRLPRLQAIPAYIIAIGLFPEHAPHFARRAGRSEIRV
jgi:hypothetical protein